MSEHHKLKAIITYAETTPSPSKDAQTRLDFARDNFDKKWFTRKNYLALHYDISTSTASRDLLGGVKIKTSKQMEIRTKQDTNFLPDKIKRLTKDIFYPHFLGITLCITPFPSS